MTIQEIMERTGIKKTALAKARVLDAVNLIKSGNFEELREDKQNIIDFQREYILPNDMVAIKSISIKDTTDSKYKRIRRLASESTVREDTDPG